MIIRLEPDDAAAWTEMEGSFLKAWNSGEYQGEQHSFARISQLFAVFTPKRWELIERLQATGPSSLRGLARALGRDVKRVHEDVAVLLDEGIVERTEDEKLIVPFETISIEAKLRAPKAA
jgi:predicted transcriptional regulator